MVYIEDGLNADTRAIGYKSNVTKVTSSDKTAIKLAPGGGWVARIMKIK